MHRTLACALFALAAAGPAAAQGFGVYEQGACTMGRAGAAVARPCADGSAAFYNPAGIAGQPARLSVGATVIAPHGGFTSTATGLESELERNFYPVPTVYIQRPLTDRLSAGLGVFAPYGLATEWSDASQGRFLGYETILRAVYAQPTLAAKLHDRVKVGAGLDVTFLSLKLRQRLDLSQQRASPAVTFGQLGIPFGTDFADADLGGESVDFGWHAGVQIDATDWLSVGARYLSRQKHEIDEGDVRITQVATGRVLAPGNVLGAPAGTPVDALVASQFAPGGLLTDQSATAVVRLPEQAVFGIAVKPVAKLTVLFDAQWTGWDAFTAVPIDFERLPDVVLEENFRDTWGFRLGGEYQVGETTVLRAGYYTHEAAAPAETVTPNLPEAGRTSFTLGIGGRLADHLTVDAAYQYIDQADRQGRVLPGPNTGLYEFDAHLVGLNFAFAF